MRLRRSKPTQRVERILVATDRSETAERAVAFAQELAEQARELAGERGHSSVVVADDPAEAIVEAVRREKADVVVVGSVGMSGRKEFLLRNVPNRVSHNAPCTVVIVQTHGDT